MNDPPADAVSVELVLTTETDPETAERLARMLLEAEVAACVTLLPVRSCYRWKGAIETASEVQLLIKTRPGQLDEVRASLQRLHSYDVPEWIHWTAHSDGAYGRWLLSPDAPPPDGADLPADVAPAG
jgi:periplasmic divalent cation tolerance protein